MSDRDEKSTPGSEREPAASARLRELLTGAPGMARVLDDIKDYAVFVVDLNGRIASWNSGAQQMKGYSPEEAIGMPFEKLFTPEDVASGKPAREMQTAREEGVYTGQGQRLRKDGSRFHADVVLRRMDKEDGSAEGFVKVTRDITERNRLHELEVLRTEFQGRLLGIVSHDLRSPLSVVTFSAAALLERGGLSEAQARSVARMQSSAWRALRLIDDLLDYTQARLGGGLSIRPASVDVEELVARVVEEARVTHPARTVLVQALGEGAVVWDADRVVQLLLNLLRNALEHGRAGSSVKLTLDATRDPVVLEVHNEGEPIPGELLPDRIFESFTQQDAARTASGSVGLGLFIVREITASHGGTVAVRSSLDEGTTFSVALPRVVAGSA